MVQQVVKDSVADNSIVRVRMALSSMAYMANNEAFADFVDSLIYAESNIDSLYEEDNGEQFTDEISGDNYVHIADAIGSNFSKEKCELLKRVGKKLFDNKLNEEDNSEEVSSFFTQMICLVKKFFAQMKSSLKKNRHIIMKVIAVIGCIAIVVSFIVMIFKILNR